MTVTVTHTKVSAIPDGTDTTVVRPSDWNATHTLVGLGTAAELDAGVANGVATLDSSGKVPSSQLSGLVTSVTGTAPVVSSGGTTPAISMAAATTSVNGYLTSTDWNTFNNKQAAGTYVNSVSATAPLTSTGGVTPTLAMPAATSSVNGYLTSADWTTFNSKGSVTSVAASVPSFLSVAGSPITSSGTLAISYSGTALPIANGGTNATTANTGFNNLAPSQTSNSGKFLTTNGTDTSWATVTASPAGSNTQVQFNNSGAFGASASLVWNGTALTTPSLNSTNTFGFKNRIINGGFILNQRVYVSGTALSAGIYGHDRWKGGASGGTYTFTQGSTGVNTTITITAGSLQQVVEGCNMPEGGTYVLSWTGTAQAKFNGGSYGASPLAVTSITAGANVTIEFGTGTCGNVQLESGSTATSFDVRDYSTELILAQRYFRLVWTCTGTYFSASACLVFIPHPGMRAAPTAGATANIVTTDSFANNYTQTTPGCGIQNNNADGGAYSLTNLNNTPTVGRGAGMYTTGGAITLTAEL